MRPESAGFSPARLTRLDEVMTRRYVEGGDLPGMLIHIYRKGQLVHTTMSGQMDIERQKPMREDAIFRIYSMSKPITTVALMMLVEEGKLGLGDAAHTYIPEWKNLGVYASGMPSLLADAPASFITTPVQRPMKIIDLATHTSGLTYTHLAGPQLKKAYEAADLGEHQSNAELVAKLARVPLAYQPGSTWQYGYSTDVLGRVVEVASGQPLDRFFAERILKPLGMSATGFGPVAAARVAEPQLDKASGKRPPLRDVTKTPVWLSGGSGLLSSAADYLRFCQMLLNGGELGGVRLLAPATVALMSADHLAPGIGYGAQMRAMFGALAPTPENGLGFGLGFAVRNEAGRCALPGSVGDYSWSGVAGTYFWIDPRQQLIAILMMQAPSERMHYRYLMRAMVYQAMVG